ncbi:hypothetical protein LG045_02670 [Limosilactobacillus gastricus]|nr:hypothetical protein LG045_02670 [Limosilactobacillus gastricus]
MTSPKSKHRHMHSDIDFKKVFIDTNKRRGRYFSGAINLNLMFPVPTWCINDFNFSEMDQVKSFKNSKEKSKYISFLKHQLKSINQLNLPEAATKLYNYRYEHPESSVARRCLDFKQLEIFSKEYDDEIDK